MLRWKAVRLGRQLEAHLAHVGGDAFHSGNVPAITSMVERIVGVAGDLRGYLDQASDPDYAAVSQDCVQLTRPLSRGGQSHAVGKRNQGFASCGSSDC